MQNISILAASVLLMTAACSGNTVEPGGTGAATGATSNGATSNGTTSSGAATSGTTSGGTGGSPSGPTITLTMDSFSVPSGAEIYNCQNFVNPFNGQDAYIQEFESHMAAGSHHMLLFYKDGVTENGPLEACSGLEFAATPYGSQELNDSLTFPPGVAAVIPAGTGIRLQSHYLNTTPSTVTAHVEVVFHLTTAGDVKYPAGVLFVIDTNIDVPPASSTVNSNDCTIPQDMNVIRTSSHMHRHGTAFVATVGSETVYQTDTWSDPKPDLFDPAMVVAQGAPLHFACSFTNNGTVPLTFGESALTNEMCIFIASYYPTSPSVATIGADNCVASQTAAQ